MVNAEMSVLSVAKGGGSGGLGVRGWGVGVLAVILAGALAGCGGGDPGRSAATAATARIPRQTIVVVDLSGSRAAHMLGEGRRYLDDIISGLDFGDRLVLIEMHQRSPVDDVRRWADSVPMPPDPMYITTRDRRMAEGVREGARAVVEKFFLPPTGPAPHTDIFSTLQVAGEYVRSAGRRATTIVLLSDMLQSANGIEMERGRAMPGPGWVDERKATGRLPRLEGVCVGVIGADASSENGKMVQQFWQRYFEAVGAQLEERNWRVLGTGVGGVEC
jgi:hypothetical protein